MMLSKYISTAVLATALMGTSIAAQADAVKIGFVTTLTTPAAVIGEDMKQSVELLLNFLAE